MDRVYVEGLVLKGKHGVHQQEREKEQDFSIDIAVEFDTQIAAKSDDIADTADYAKFVQTAKKVVHGNSFYLIEKLAQTIADELLLDKRIRSVEVSIRKPAVLESGVPGVTIVRTQ